MMIHGFSTRPHYDHKYLGRFFFRLWLLCTVSTVALPAATVSLEKCSLGSAEKGTVTLQCDERTTVRLQAVTPEMIRVRISADGSFPESLPVRWGFVRDDWPAVSLKAKTAGRMLHIETPALKIRIDLSSFRLTLLNSKGEEVFRQTAASLGDGNALSIGMSGEEHFYGLGFQRTALDLKGHKLQWYRTFRSGEATVPFFLSSRGYGFYSNNTWKHIFDFTGDGPTYKITSDGGQLDYYLIYGPDFKNILHRYTDLTGKPMLAPRWALGIGYQSRYFEDQKGVSKIAEGFRREDIPIDWIGLEPGWEAVPYSMKWQWNPVRFPDPDGMIRTLGGMGIKMGLWESGDAPKTGYTDEEKRKEWYRPRIEAAIRKGIKFFKQDDPYPRMISSQEWLPPEYNKTLGGSGTFRAAEMNNTTNSLYSDTAMKEYRRVTGERAMIMFNGYNSSISSHRWPFTWEADFPLGTGALSASLSGHSLVSTRDRNEAPDGMHLGYLAPFCYLESWAYYKEPWFYSEDLLEMNRFYVKLRYRLIPYLYSSVRQSVESGLPLMRPMTLEFQQDPNTARLASQFLLGDWLLVGSATAKLTSGAELPAEAGRRSTSDVKPRIYLPKGTWFDFWTGSRMESQGEWKEAVWPRTAGGPLYVKGGAMIPMGPITSYTDQEPLEVVRLDIYPSGESAYRIYEDDGSTYAYEKGEYAITEIRCQEKPRTIQLRIGERKGSYRGMPARRSYLLSLHTSTAPASVRLDGKRIPAAESRESLFHTPQGGCWLYESGILWIKPAAGWSYGYDSRGPAGDRDRDTVQWEGAAESSLRPFELAIGLSASAPPPKAVYGPPATLDLATSYTKLPADGTSSVSVRITVQDASKRPVLNSSLPIRLELAGNGKLACGNTVCSWNPIDGIVQTTLTAGTEPGTLRLRALAEGLPPMETRVEVLRGTMSLKASPPERIKLSSDGSWLPLRVTLYATIYASGERLHAAETAVRLHVTGGSGKTPEDREVKAVNGIAVFPDIFFEKPPNYQLHLTGTGLEPAQIAIY